MAILAIAILGFVGKGVEGRLVPASLDVPGTAAARGNALLERHFGQSAPFAILLRGPAPALDRQGPRLIRALRADPRVTVLSPWDGRQLARLRPTPRKALIFADFHTDSAAAVAEAVPRLDRILEREVRPPVDATQTGYATLSRAIQEESISSTKKAELIAVPFLLLVLLLVFRSPVAAVIPLLFGAATVVATRGVLSLVAERVDVDAFALTVATMMGLALGVDYALLMVSRFREELGTGKGPEAAAGSARRTAGRTTIFAGITLIVSMLVSLFILPGGLLISLAGTAILVTLISLVTSYWLAPALLCLLGENVNRFSLPRRGDQSHSALHALLTAALARPVPIAVAISAVLLVLSAPALAIRTGPPSAGQLPPSDSTRIDSELVASELGPGWDAPYVVVAAAQGPITTAANLRHLARFQDLLAAQKGVQVVIGPKEVARRTAPLRRRGNDLLARPGARKLSRLEGLGPKLAQAADGVGRLRSGIDKAAAGAGLLGKGSGRAREGAEKIASGLERAAAGGRRATGAINRLSTGAGKIAEGQQTAEAGSLAVALGLHDLLPRLRKGSLRRAREIRSELREIAKGDPAAAAAATKASALVVALAAARDEVRKLRGNAARLHAGMARIAAGGDKLAAGTDRLAAGAGRLGSALDRLAGGAGALAGGLGRLRDGTEALAGGLDEGAERSQPLQDGLSRAGVKVSATATEVAGQRQQIRSKSPHLFESGYFVLSALDGANPRMRATAAQAIDLDSGQAASILVIPRYSFNTDGSEALDHRLNQLAAGFAAKTGLAVGVAGGAAQLADYNQVTRSRVPLMILAMTVVTFLALVVLLRAVLLAALAVLLNLMTVGVAFGVLVLLSHLPASVPLGGHDYIDTIGAAGIFGIVFGLSVDYAVFLLARMREAYDAGGDHRGAISFGLERTAGVITGAAAIMLAVFIVFAGARISTVSQLGVGLAVAVALDATVVRILLLPALMLLIGERVWWLPRPLARILPRIELHPA
jgi:RND superfamily putative drug exporter